MADLNTQFYKGYNYPDKSHYISKFFAPAYSNVSLGMDFRPKSNYSLYLSPLAGKLTPYDKQIGNVDVNWDVLINMKINKYLSATLNTTLKYDNDVKTFNDEGEKHGAKVQFKEVLGIGVAYNF